MDDLISRQWLIECVNKRWIKFDTEKDENRFIHLVRDIAPSVGLERQKGRWTIKNGELAIWDVCSECKKMVLHKAPFYNFCPNCGADMRGEQE